MQTGRYSFGPSFYNDAILMSVFAPELDRVAISFGEESTDLEKQDNGFWQIELDRSMESRSYSYFIDGGGPFPDPAGRFMPDGIDGASQILDPGSYEWKIPDWKGLPLDQYIIEEIHTGTFTDSADYRGIEKKLGYLQGMGITAIEIMPVAQFYGTRNWGYDGVYIYSPQHSYGRPDELMHLVDSIHEHGICAILDVVYNHSGPVGNYLDRFAPFHSTVYNNDWGNCFNLDGKYSEQIRKFILENTTYWLREFRFDALRLDAVHGIVDHSPVHILKEMSRRVDSLARETGRNIFLIAESDSNDSKLTMPDKQGGMGIDAQWNDDFHHSLHAFLTGEDTGYYCDFGKMDDIYSVLKDGFLYQGQYSKYLGRNRGTRWSGTPEKLVVFGQNHDQVGNRAFGDRLISLAGDRKAKLFAAFTVLSPFTPLLFMAEEFGATSPFLYFIDSDDPDFAKKVYSGRVAEFKRFRWNRKPPDPDSLSTFNQSKINWDHRGTDAGKYFEQYYRDLISIRKAHIAGKTGNYSVELLPKNVIKILYRDDLMILGSFTEQVQSIQPDWNAWQSVLNSESVRYGGPDGENVSDSEMITLSGFSAKVVQRLT